MSGDWITVLGDDGRPRRVIDAPDLCGAGHPTVVTQLGTCPVCHALNIPVFWCSTASCRWRVPGGRHADSPACKPGRFRDPGETFGVRRR